MRRKFPQLRITAKFISDPVFKIEVTQGIQNIHLHPDNQTLGCEKFYCVAHAHPHFNNCFARTSAPHLNFRWSHPHPHSHFFFISFRLICTWRKKIAKCAEIVYAKSICSFALSQDILNIVLYCTNMYLVKMM